MLYQAILNHSSLCHLGRFMSHYFEVDLLTSFEQTGTNCKSGRLLQLANEGVKSCVEHIHIPAKRME